MGSLLLHRFKLLLLILASLILISPLMLEAIAHTAPDAVRVIVVGLSVALLTVGSLAVRREPRVLGTFIALSVASLLIDVAAAFLWPDEIGYWDHGLRILILVFLAAEVLRYLFLPDVVNFDTLCASLCVYLMIGLIWMNLYVIVETITPQSIVSSADSDRPRTDALRGMDLSIHMLYFSFTTLTSVGFGDIVPRTNIARMLAVTEALVGQCYLLIMVSRLVGLHVAQAFPGGAEPAGSHLNANSVSADPGAKRPPA